MDSGDSAQSQLLLIIVLGVVTPLLGIVYGAITQFKDFPFLEIKTIYWSRIVYLIACGVLTVGVLFELGLIERHQLAGDPIRDLNFTVWEIFLFVLVVPARDFLVRLDNRSINDSHARQTSKRLYWNALARLASIGGIFIIVQLTARIHSDILTIV